MRILTLDFETYWTADYTLSKLSTEEYVRDPRFKTHMVGIKNGDGPTQIIPGNRVQAIFDKIPWHETAVLCQHAHFDGLILSHIYGKKPAFWLDTLSMFRAIYPHESASLSNQAEVLELSKAKGGGFYNIVSTKDKETLTPYEFNACATYCKDDCDLTKEAFDKLKGHFPTSELRLIDITIRMFTEAVFNLDHDLLIESWHDERQATLALFQAAMPELAYEAYDAIENNNAAAWKKLKTPLASNPQFAAMLLAMNIEPPKKLSPAMIKKGLVNPETCGEPPEGLIPTATKKEKEAYFAANEYPHSSEIWTYAFGKSDEAFKLMLQSDNEALVTLVEARLGVKSTIKETRAQRFIGIASRGEFPVYLKYYGAHTGRYGGGDKVNPQNLNKFCPQCKGEGKGCAKCGETGVSPLRRAIQAPDGHVIVVRDLSAIEARVNAWLAGQEDMVETFRRGEDIYCQMAGSITGRNVTKSDKSLRFLGKTIVLGCGYGLGWRKFQQMLRVGMLGDSGRLLGWDIADPLGVDLNQFLSRFSGYVSESLPPGATYENHALHCACAAQIIKAFRDNKTKIPEMWDTCQTALGYILRGEEFHFGKVMKTHKDGLVLPNGMLIRYTQLEGKKDGRRIEYKILKNKRKNEWGKVYGGLVDENIVQALSRIILTDAMLKMRSEGMKVAHQVHDEILVVSKENDAERVYDRMGVLMSAPPSWAPDLPLASEGGWNKMYIK